MSSQDDYVEMRLLPLCYLFILLYCSGWLAAEAFKPLPGKVDNVTNRLLHILQVVEKQQKMNVRFCQERWTESSGLQCETQHFLANDLLKIGMALPRCENTKRGQ